MKFFFFFLILNLNYRTNYFEFHDMRNMSINLPKQKSRNIISFFWGGGGGVGGVRKYIYIF